MQANGDVLFNVIDVGDEVIVTKKTEGPVDYSKDNKEAWDNLLFCNQYEEIFKIWGKILPNISILWIFFSLFLLSC